MAFLPYIAIDQEINPDEPLMFYLRLGLVVVSLLCLAAYFSAAFKEKGLWLMTFFATYLYLATALLTVLADGHPAYIGGYNFILMCSLFSLLPLSWHFTITTGSTALLVVLLFYTGELQLDDPGLRYSLRDLVSAWVVASLGYIIVYSVRRKKFLDYRKMYQQKQVIEQESERLNQSLRYAERIQSILLGSTENISRFFIDSFIINRPRDLVSGDFYWSWNCREMATGIASSVGDRFSQLIIVGDCTGHGVPAGFMTLMMINFLDTIVKREGILSPNELLYHLDQRVLQVFHEEDRRIDHGGADLIAVLFSFDYRHIWYAGAKNPLYLARNGKIERKDVSRYSLGVNQRKEALKEFELYEMELERGDQLYLMSDGYKDQYSPRRKRTFSRRRLMQLLAQHSDKDMETQREILSRTFEQWKGDEAQTDDILILGLRI